jgi:hypothetical protein
VRRSAGFGAALLAGVIVVAALLLGLPLRVGLPGAEVSPSPSLSAADIWGPLTVIPPQSGSDTGRAEGLLLIRDGCVYLESAGEVSLLVWPSDRTRWHPETQAITFNNYDGRLVTVGDGDHVVLGGGGGSAAESGVPAEGWLRRMVWVVPPAATCSVDLWWGVGAVGA